MLLFSLIPDIPSTKELLTVLGAHTGIVTLSLLVTAIRQTIANELSLFHAICVNHILLFIGIGFGPAGECPQSRALSSPAQTSSEYRPLEIQVDQEPHCRGVCYTIPHNYRLLILGAIPVGPRGTLRTTVLPQRQSEV